ncbi:MAG: hypothetical protein RLZZ337_1588 [Bacteroidota bacterium]
MNITLSHTRITEQTQDLSGVLAKAKKKDRLAQAHLYKQFHGKFLGLCLRYFENRDDALEALNHGFLKIFNNLKNCDTKQSFEGWAYRIIKNTAIDYARKALKKSDFISISEQEIEASIHPDYTENVMPDEWIQLLQHLPAATRMVFNLVALEHYKHSEIAKLLDISEGTSKWHLNQARKILKQKLEEKI